MCGQQPENPETKPKHMEGKGEAQVQFAYEGSLLIVITYKLDMDLWRNIQD